ncbi:MAG: triose-phosphate isomerase [Gemmatimonadetes bacterium]|nr:triose-phosphate isomerase [Gemmatimonadota bacterium]MBI2616251.1 triose-phosphate isomerase [Gemmatimonadota bacterium]
MRRRLFAANWKMHHGPGAARSFLGTFLEQYARRTDRDVWFFPPAISFTTVLDLVRGRPDLGAGVQNVHWEPKGAFTGEISVPMLVEAGANGAIVGHSERRHGFGETDEESGNKARALLAAGLVPVFCVGEKLEEREAGETWAVVRRQLNVLDGLPTRQLAQLVVAYEPVWAIGTGRNATPADAAEVHRSIRGWFEKQGVNPDDVTVLYGGSVNLRNGADLLAEPEIDGVLVGGASLDPTGWAQLISLR